MTTIPPHIKRDVQKLSYDRTVEGINRICETFGTTPDMLMLVSTSAMRGAFLMMYCASRLKTSDAAPSPQHLLSIWSDVMEKEFDFMVKGFDAAKEYKEQYNGH